MKMPVNQHYLQKADENIPPILYTPVKTDNTVKIVKSDADFFGYAAVPNGKMPAVVHAGDSFVLDFGRHCVGKLSFHLEDDGRYLDAPVRVKLKFGEIPYEIGRDFATYHGELCISWLDEDIVNLDNIGDISLPRRHSFRYLEVTVLATPRPTRLSDFCVMAGTCADVTALKPLPEGFDPELAAIDRVAAATLRDCMQTAYEDGPKRDRRLWSGDLRLQALTDRYLYGNDMLARRCLYLFAACDEKGLYLPGCLYQVPYLTWDRGISLFDYAMLWCVSVADYYDKTGDLETVRDLFPVVNSQISLALSNIDKNGIIHLTDDWKGFLDWAAGLKRVAGAQGVLIYTLERVAPLASAIGDEKLAKAWQTACTDARTASVKHLYNAKKKAFINDYDEGQCSVQATVWMILAGVVTGDEAKEVLRRALESKDSVKPVTPHMHHYLVEAMFTIGMKDEGVKHIKEYWGAMVNYGADTFWEVFKPDEPDLSPYGDNIMHSFCHAWSCSPSYFIRKYLV